MSYVDGFITPVPEAKLADYRKMARRAGRIWGSSSRRPSGWRA